MKNRGFSLIEVLIVISIVALFLGMFIPPIQKARSKKSDPTQTEQYQISPSPRMTNFDVGNWVLIKDFDIKGKIDRISDDGGTTFTYHIIYKNNEGNLSSIDVSEPNLESTNE